MNSVISSQPESKEHTFKMEKAEKMQANDHEKTEPRPECRHYIMLIALFGILYAGVLNGFVMNEWTQKVIRNQYFPNHTKSFSGCSAVNSTETDEDYKKVQKVTAQWQMIFSLAENIPTALVTLVLPSYTDSNGRKFLIIFSTAGMTAKSVIITSSVYFEGSLWYLFASNIVVGCTGSIFSLFSASFSMVADLTHTENERTIGIVVTDVFLLFSIVAASYCSGLFVETLELNFFKTSMIASAISVVVLLLTFVVKESHPSHKRNKRGSVLNTIKRMTDFYISKEFKGRRKAYIFLLLSFGMATIAGINRGSMETLYFLGKPFCWGPSKIGTFSTVRNAAQAFVGLCSVRVFQMCFSNATIGIISTLSNAMSYIIEGFATTTLMIYMVPLSGMFSFLVIPMIRSLMSSITTVDKQGAVFASVATIEVICTLAANLSQNAVYSVTMSFMNGFVFLMCAVISIINMLFMVGFKRAQREMDKKDDEDKTIGITVKNGD